MFLLLACATPAEFESSAAGSIDEDEVSVTDSDLATDSSVVIDTSPPEDTGVALQGLRARIEVFQVDGVRMTASTARAWKRMKTAAEADGVRLRLNSGFRTMGEQQSLYNAYQNGTGNLAAYPGYSNHQNGVALDIDVVSDAAYDWIHANGNRFGFKRTVASEPWHWEYLG